MRSKTAQRISDNTLDTVKRKVSLYAGIAIRVNELIAEKGIDKDNVPEGSQLYDWFRAGFSFDLKDIIQLECELGENIIYATKSKFHQLQGIINKLGNLFPAKIDAIKFSINFDTSGHDCFIPDFWFYDKDGTEIDLHKNDIDIDSNRRSEFNECWSVYEYICNEFDCANFDLGVKYLYKINK